MNNFANGLISVIIPTYNSASFLGEAIESVLRQDLPVHEIIVIDDGSTDNTESVVKNINGNIRYLYQENHGPSHARNKGIEIAKGDYIAFIDADDVWVSENLSLHMNQFKTFKNLDVSVGLTCKMSFNSARDVDLELARENASLHLSLCASVMKKTVFEDVGFFDEDLLLGQDTDWFLKAKEKRKTIAISRELVSLYRRHSNNRTNNKKMVNYYFFKVFKKAKDRRVHSTIPLSAIMKKPENQDELIDMWHNAERKKY
jgi:glycosyltransferase involved in cell wall biosynthesis